MTKKEYEIFCTLWAKSKVALGVLQDDEGLLIPREQFFSEVLLEIHKLADELICKKNGALRKQCYKFKEKS